MEKELGVVRALLDRFNSEINYCHWKSNQHFSDALIGVDDLDILIDREQYGKVTAILQELKYKRFYIPDARTYVGIEDYIGFDYETGKMVHLHLHSQLVVGEKHLKGFLLPIEYWVLKNRRWDNQYEVYFSSAYDELLLLIIRIGMKIRKRDVLKRRIIDGGTKREFEWLKEQCPDFVEYVTKQEWLSERIQSIISLIYKNEANWIKATQLKRYLYRDISCYSQGIGIYNTAKRNWREFERIILEIKKRYIKSKYTFTRRRSATGGITIAFLGSDGAGKSSTIDAIYKWLFQFMDVRLVYLGSGDGNSSLLRAPFKIALKIAQDIGIVKKSNNFSDSSLSENKSKKVGFARRVWVYLLSLERIKKLTVASRCRTRGFIVLTDRYLQSEYEGLCDGPRISHIHGLAAETEKKAFRIAKLCPPDLAIKMIVPPEVAVERKPGEINIETSRNLTERVKNIRFSEKTKCVEIDSAQEQEKVWLDVKRAIWDVI